MKLRYQIKWSTSEGGTGELCIVDNSEKTNFQYHDTDSIDWMLRKIDTLNEQERKRLFPPLRLVEHY